MNDRIVDALPPRLAERTRLLRDAPVPVAGRYVLYCMDGNLRARENQALDAALTAANALERPLLVLVEIAETARYASDRHHRFLLEGARDVLGRLEADGIATLACVHRPGRREDAGGALAQQAAMLVADDVPTRPYRTRRRRLIDALERCGGGPMIAVDASCLVPMCLVGAAHDRAYRFRKATQELRRARLDRTFPPVRPSVRRLSGALPVEGDDLAALDLGELTAACEIDHGVPPVPEFPGGETAADEHWQSWRDQRLPGYAARRNDALRETWVSRLSPYLRHGMIAATRIAREAAGQHGKGPDKFLDELLVWREMSWSYAFHEAAHDDLGAVLPDWARDSLARREIDARPALYSWETLARGGTDDPLWNAAQQAYLRRGYLHNNLRMTWGKALLTWTPDAEACGRLLVDLNDRFSLDGGDPNSYQGLFWCLGAFDRPFDPERPIFGRVRHRSTAVHAQRLDVASYAARQVRADADQLPRVAVIGAGLAGLICARTLADHGIPVTVFDKGRRPGGRTAAKRLDTGGHADHGAPVLDLADPRLAPYRTAWHDDGRLAGWPIAGAGARSVAVPNARALAEHLARDLDVRQSVAVTALEPGPAGWRVGPCGDGAAIGPDQFDRVVVAVPAPQAAELLRAPAPALAERAGQAMYAPCLSAVAAFPQRIAAAADWIAPDGSILAAAVREQAKPGRADHGSDVWVLHATPAWSETNLDAPHDRIAADLAAAFAASVPDAPAAAERIGHRWRYARVVRPLGQDCLFDARAGVGACGDWCLGPDAGHALLSGLAMAGRMFAAEPELTRRGRPTRSCEPA